MRQLVRKVLKRLVGPQPLGQGRRRRRAGEAQRSALNNVALSEGYVAMHRCEDGHYRLVRPLALTPKAISEAGLR